MNEAARLARYALRDAVAERTDRALERALRDRTPLEPTLGELLPDLADVLGARALVVITVDETLAEKVFRHGSVPPDVDLRLPDLAEAREPVVEEHVVAVPLDVAGEPFGAVIAAPLSRFAAPEDTAYHLRAIAELLDNHLGAIALSRRKYLVTKKLTDALREPVLDTGVDHAIQVLRAEVAFDSLVLAFRHEDDARGVSLRYRAILGDGRTLDSRTHSDPAFASHTLLWLRDGARGLLEHLGLDHFREEVLIHGVRDARVVGRVLVTNRTGEFCTHDRELLERFADALRQRVVDYNREWKLLAHTFAPATVHRLLATEGYREKYLAPREHQAAILYADIAGFSRVSEQVLREPARIGALVDLWGERVVELVWEQGGVFDKMVGDCAIALFGPPFYDQSPRATCEAALRAAAAIRDFTRSLSDDPRLPELKGIEPPLGVATGVNFAPICVGIFGPDEDYTGFSSGMNNTARLQGVASRGEILAMESVVETVRPAFRFGDLLQAKVKNVAEPLSYRRLEELP